MREQSEGTLPFAHALTQAADRVETFTLGTRLTRVSHALRIRSREQALDAVGAAVADFDGGTRIGDALEAFLSVPRFAGYARGAAVLILSDGLERGTPDSLVGAIQKLARLTWRLDWLTPLAAQPGFEPRTEALAACLPHLDGLVPGDRVEALCSPCSQFVEVRMIDAHHHIWLQKDLPWLLGLKSHAFLVRTGPIKRDYPISEFTADLEGTGIRKSVYVQANWAPNWFEDEVAWSSLSPMKPVGRTRSSAMRISRSRMFALSSTD